MLGLTMGKTTNSGKPPKVAKKSKPALEKVKKDSKLKGTKPAKRIRNVDGPDEDIIMLPSSPAPTAVQNLAEEKTFMHLDADSIMHEFGQILRTGGRCDFSEESFSSLALFNAIVEWCSSQKSTDWKALLQQQPDDRNVTVPIVSVVALFKSKYKGIAPIQGQSPSEIRRWLEPKICGGNPAITQLMSASFVKLYAARHRPHVPILPETRQEELGELIISNYKNHREANPLWKKKLVLKEAAQRVWFPGALSSDNLQAIEYFEEKDTTAQVSKLIDEQKRSIDPLMELRIAIAHHGKVNREVAFLKEQLKKMEETETLARKQVDSKQTAYEQHKAETTFLAQMKGTLNGSDLRLFIKFVTSFDGASDAMDCNQKIENMANHLDAMKAGIGRPVGGK